MAKVVSEMWDIEIKITNNSNIIKVIDKLISMGYSAADSAAGGSEYDSSYWCGRYIVCSHTLRTLMYFSIFHSKHKSNAKIRYVDMVFLNPTPLNKALYG